MSGVTEPVCAHCKRELTDVAHGQPCPGCGSTDRELSRTVIDGIGVSDHLTAVGIRAGRAFAFSESEGKEFTRYAHLELDGTVLLDLKGLAPRNEQDSALVCGTLVEVLNADGAEAKVLGPGEADEDSVLSINGERVGVQVVRALSDPHFWRRLATQGEVGRVRLDVSAARNALRAAIEHKSGIPPGQRATLILLLDAYRVPAVALGVVAEEFVQVNGRWAEQLGFRAIYVVGPSTAFVHRLARRDLSTASA